MTEEIPEVTISFRYEFEDFKKAFLSNYFNAKRSIFLYVMASILMIGTIVFVIFNEPVITINYNDMLFLIMATAILFIAVFRPYAFTNTIRQQCLTTYQYNQIEHIAVLSKNGIHWKTSQSERFINWTFLYKVVEQKDAFCFYLNILEHRIIPKRVLETKQIALIRNIIISSVGPKYKVQGINKKKITG